MPEADKPCSTLLDACPGCCPMEVAEAGLCLGPPGLRQGTCSLGPRGPDAEELSVCCEERIRKFKGFALLLFLLGFLRCGTLDKT